VKKKGSWRSRVFVPYIFSIIEAIIPRMVASLPKISVDPVGPEDVAASKQISRVLDFSAKATDLDLELIKIYRQAAKYGTAIGKTYYERRTAKIRTVAPPAAPLSDAPALDANGKPMLDINGQPMMMKPLTNGSGSTATGTEPTTTKVTVYDGPVTQWIDIFNFWVAPEAADLDSARYTIERVFREMSYITDKVKKGIYRFPENMTLEDITAVTDEAQAQRRNIIGESTTTDVTRKPVEIWEIWTDDGRCITVANRKAILRVMENPYNHGMKPYFQVVDYLNEGEFWGSGEIEAIEGLQDLENAIVNQRIDNIRLTMDQMLAVNTEALEDLRDLQPRPGGVIRVTGDRNANDVVFPVNTGDVTQSAFQEAEQIEKLIERVSGISAYQMGLDSPSMNDTAHGVQTITEQGNTKFSLKIATAEILGIRRMARQWGSLLQQYSTGERWLRTMGPDGEWAFEQIQADSLLGAVDYTVQIGSSSQTDSVAKEQAMTLLQVMAGLMPQSVPQLAQDVLEAFGKKNVQAYMGQQAAQAGLLQSQMQQSMSPGAPAQGQPPDQTGAQPPLPAPGQQAIPPGPPAPPPGPDMAQLAQVAASFGLPPPQNDMEVQKLLQLLALQQQAPPQQAPAVQYQVRPRL